jgi:hypothetical protein
LNERPCKLVREERPEKLDNEEGVAQEYVRRHSRRVCGRKKRERANEKKEEGRDGGLWPVDRIFIKGTFFENYFDMVMV